MGTRLLQQKTNRIIDKYIAELNHLSMEQILMKPSESDWSVGQVYMHVWMSATGYFFKKAKQCMIQEEVFLRKGKNWKGMLVFLLGRMPDVKVKMPKQVAVEPRQPESKEQLIARMMDVKEQASIFISAIPSADLKYKLPHPIMGYLNMAEWVALCNMHFEHHVQQISRIKKHFGWKSTY